MAGEVRKRRGGKKKQAKAAKSEEEKKTDDVPRPVIEEQQEETAWQTFKGHPLVMVLPIVLIPYLFYLAYLFFQLQRPDLLAKVTFNMLQLRPHVSNTDERQVLIVGTMSSGTVQVASDLREQLGLEVGHEISDADWDFVRDGTVSWFHGIRFMPPLELRDLVQRWSQLCGNYTANMGFHPNMYKSSACSGRQKWSKCWANACLNILKSEWGCASLGSCETPFRTSLLQVRHPMRTIESLVTKFCQGGLNGTIHSSFVTYASVLFPDHSFENDSCIEATAYYVVEYNQAMIKAQSEGFIDNMYRIEETSPCDVARMAGLFDRETTVYEPNYDKVEVLCKDPTATPNQVMKSIKHKVNVGQVILKWEDLKGGIHGSERKKGDTSVESSIRDLTKKLGYDPSQDYTTDTEFQWGIEDLKA